MEESEDEQDEQSEEESVEEDVETGSARALVDDSSDPEVENMTVEPEMLAAGFNLARSIIRRCRITY